MNRKKLLRLLSTPITLIILLGLLAAGVFWGYKTVTAKVPGPPKQSCEVIEMTELQTSSVTVNIYNGGNQRGLAGRVADTLREGGFLIGAVDNTDARVMTILIVGASSDSPEVQLVASWFDNVEIQGDKRPDHTVDIILGNSYEEKTGYAVDPPKSIQIPNGEVCLPPSPTPEPSSSPTDEATPTSQPS